MDIYWIRQRNWEEDKPLMRYSAWQKMQGNVHACRLNNTDRYVLFYLWTYSVFCWSSSINHVHDPHQIKKKLKATSSKRKGRKQETKGNDKRKRGKFLKSYGCTYALDNKLLPSVHGACNDRRILRSWYATSTSTSRKHISFLSPPEYAQALYAFPFPFPFV